MAKNTTHFERATDPLGTDPPSDGKLLARDPRETLTLDAQAPHLSGGLIGVSDGDAMDTFPLSSTRITDRGS